MFGNGRPESRANLRINLYPGILDLGEWKLGPSSDLRSEGIIAGFLCNSPLGIALRVATT